MKSATESPPPRLLAAAVAVIAAAAVIALILLISSASGGSSTPVHHEPKYGGIPKWLPKTESTDERVVTASAAKPVLAIQGNTVSVDLAHGKVMATAVGPEVPEEGEFPVPATSPCTFIVTFTRGSGSVRIDPRDFTVSDDEGHLHHPKLSGMHGGPPPTQVPAGKTTSIRVQGVFPTGDGALSWAPGSSKPIVSWDFDIEID